MTISNTVARLRYFIAGMLHGLRGHKQPIADAPVMDQCRAEFDMAEAMVAAVVGRKKAREDFGDAWVRFVDALKFSITTIEHLDELQSHDPDIFNEARKMSAGLQTAIKAAENMNGKVMKQLLDGLLTDLQHAVARYETRSARGKR
jgi:hypothetical protein